MSDLLDGPLLAALVIAEHEHHERAAAWFAGRTDFAVCPQTEAALLRFLLRLGEAPATALAVVAGVRDDPRCAFWADDISHATLDAAALGSADAFGQAYLVAVAAAHSGRLVTLEDVVAG